MIERPDLDDADLTRWVRSAWDLDVMGLRFMPVGLDGWAFAVSTPNCRFFLKVKRESPGRPALLVPRFLRDRGVTQVVAPIDTTALAPTHRVAGYCLLLYPYIDGANLWNSGLRDEQWIEYGQLLADMHTGEPPSIVGLPTETFTTTAPARIRTMATAAAHSPYLVGLWAAHGDDILRLADETQRLAGEAAAVVATSVLCHADIHPGNLLADAGGRLHVVDWDAPILAPRERDLMFVFGAEFGEHPINPHRERLFRQGYGPVDLEPTLLAYYRAERKLDDAALFIASLLDDSLSEATKENELFWLRRILAG